VDLLLAAESRDKTGKERHHGVENPALHYGYNAVVKSTFFLSTRTKTMFDHPDPYLTYTLVAEQVDHY
jgi:hypothetical protein